MVLHLSLRDLAPEMILAAQNFTDDVDHAVRERTSLHLTEQRTGNRDFVDGTLADLLRGRLVSTTDARRSSRRSDSAYSTSRSASGCTTGSSPRAGAAARATSSPGWGSDA